MRFSLNWDELSKVTKTNLSGGLAGAQRGDFDGGGQTVRVPETDAGPARPTSAGLVLPAYHNVRLVPADAASGPAGGAYDLAWREHITSHLPNYIRDGLRGLDADCWYCRQLEQWEDEAFRTRSIGWKNGMKTANCCIPALNRFSALFPAAAPGGDTETEPRTLNTEH